MPNGRLHALPRSSPDGPRPERDPRPLDGTRLPLHRGLPTGHENCQIKNLKSSGLTKGMVYQHVNGSRRVNGNGFAGTIVKTMVGVLAASPAWAQSVPVTGGNVPDADPGVSMVYASEWVDSIATRSNYYLCTGLPLQHTDSTADPFSRSTAHDRHRSHEEGKDRNGGYVVSSEIGSVPSVSAPDLAPAPANEPASEEEPAYLLVGAGAFDFHRDATAEINLAYRAEKKLLGIFKPHYGLLVGHEGNLYAWAGLLVDIPLGSYLVLTPSTSVGIYARGGGKSLGYPVASRSGLDIGYRFEGRSRMAVGFYHTSNAGLGTRNPGEESLILHYDIPLRDIFDH